MTTIKEYIEKYGADEKTLLDALETSAKTVNEPLENKRFVGIRANWDEPLRVKEIAVLRMVKDPHTGICVYYRTEGDKFVWTTSNSHVTLDTWEARDLLKRHEREGRNHD